MSSKGISPIARTESRDNHLMYRTILITILFSSSLPKQHAAPDSSDLHPSRCERLPHEPPLPQKPLFRRLRSTAPWDPAREPRELPNGVQVFVPPRLADEGGQMHEVG